VPPFSAVFLLANPLPMGKMAPSPMITGKISLDGINHCLQAKASETFRLRQDWKVNLL
jgi:hypothetical protein